MATDQIPIPDKIDLVVGHSNITIRRRWFTYKFIFLTIFAIIWDSFLFFFYSGMIGGSDTPLIAFLFPIGHVCVGIGLTYYVLCGYINRTEVIISSSDIKIKHTPLWWPGQKTIPVQNINRLLIREVSGDQYTRLEIKYISSDNREKSLMRGIEDSAHAEYYKNKIEQLLCIKTDSGEQLPR